MPLLVRLRPNVPYLLFILIAAAAVAYGVAMAGPFGIVIVVPAGLMLVLLAYPVVVSTVFRVPVVVIDASGIRLPLMGVRLGWSEVAAVTRGVDRQRQVLLVVPIDPQATLGQVRPWLRREARGNIARHGTPIVITDLSLDRPLDDIAAAVGHHLPAS